jgi:hypothetical protein
VTESITVNGLPVITAPGTATVAQGQATAISGLSLSETGNTTTSGETFTETLTDTNGLLSATGAGVSGSGTTSLTITGSLTQVNSDLATLTDKDGTAGSDTITLNATDSFGNAATQKTIAVTVPGAIVISSFTEAKGGPTGKTLTSLVSASDSVTGITSVQIEDTTASPNVDLGTTTSPSSGTTMNGTWTDVCANPGNPHQT